MGECSLPRAQPGEVGGGKREKNQGSAQGEQPGESTRHMSCDTATASMTEPALFSYLSAIQCHVACGLVAVAITWEGVRNTDSPPSPDLLDLDP